MPEFDQNYQPADSKYLKKSKHKKHKKHEQDYAKTQHNQIAPPK